MGSLCRNSIESNGMVFLDQKYVSKERDGLKNIGDFSFRSATIEMEKVMLHTNYILKEGELTKWYSDSN